MDLNQYLDPSIIASLQTGGYIIMLALMIIEGPIVALIGGFLASVGVFHVWGVFVLGWLGDTIGDFFWYSIGYFGWNIFSEKTTIDTPEEKQEIGKLDQLIHDNLFIALIIIKLTPYLPFLGLPYIGKSHIPFRRYALYVMIVSIISPGVMTYIGFHLGQVTAWVTRYFPNERSWIGWILMGVFGLFVIYVLYRFVMKKFEKKAHDIFNVQ